MIKVGRLEKETPYADREKQVSKMLVNQNQDINDTERFFATRDKKNASMLNLRKIPVTVGTNRYGSKKRTGRTGRGHETTAFTVDSTKYTSHRSNINISEQGIHSNHLSKIDLKQSLVNSRSVSKRDVI